MNRTAIVRSLLLPLLASALISLPACSKKDKGGTSGVPTGTLTILDLPLAKKIPASASAFIVLDMNGKAFKEYRASQWFDNTSYASQIEQALSSMNAAANQQPFFNWLKQAEFLDGTKPGKHIEQAVGFADIERQELGFYAQVPGSIDLQSQLKMLQETLLAEGMKAQKQSFDGADGLTVTFTGNNGLTHTVYIAAKNQHIALGSSPEVVGGLFKDTPDSGLETIRKSEAFQLALKELPAHDNLIQFSYVGVQDLLTNAALLPGGDQISQAIESADEIPFAAAVFASRMKGNFTNTIALPFKKDMKNKKEWEPFINPGDESSILKATPASALFVLRVHGQLLRSFGPAIKAAPLPGLSQDKLLNSMITVVDDLALGVTNLPGGALFPSVFVLATTKNADGLRAEIKDRLNPQTLGVPASQWQKKEINGVPVDVTMSPLGVGAFLASQQETLLVGTSDKVMKESLTALSEKKKDTLSGLSGDVRSYVTAGTTPLVLFYVDLTGIAGLMEGIEGSLSMFTGGASGIDPKTIERVRSMGLAVLSAGVTERAVQVRTIFVKKDSPKAGT